MKNFQNRDTKYSGQKGGRFEDRKSGGRFDRKEDSKPTFYGKSRGGDRSTNKEVRMYKATCSDCKKLCDVPFKPAGDKPVFCSNCFGAKRSGYDPTAASIPHDPRKTSQDYNSPRIEGKEMKQISPSHENNEVMKKQIVAIIARLDTLTLLVEKLKEEKEAVSLVKTSVSRTSKASVVTPKKVVTKKVIVKKVAVKKAVVKKVVTKKASPAKKVITKKAK